MKKRHYIPYKVQQAINNGDKELLKKLGRKGGKNSAKARKEKKQCKAEEAELEKERLRDEISFQAWIRQLYFEEVDRVAGERHDHSLDDL